MFKSWLKKRGLLEDITDKFRYIDAGSRPVDYDKQTQELLKILMTQYKSEFDQFVNRLADERDDRELKSLQRSLRTDFAPSDPWKPASKERDEIVPPMADRGYDQNNSD